MKPVNQTIVTKSKGDCIRACVASMFELDIIQVPHFLLFKSNWFSMYYSFIWSMGYDLSYIIYNPKDKSKRISRKNLINGCIMASVLSKTHEDTTHLVLLNSVGRVIHDPNPNKRWEGRNVVKTGDIRAWYSLRKCEHDKRDYRDALVSIVEEINSDKCSVKVIENYAKYALHGKLGK